MKPDTRNEILAEIQEGKACFVERRSNRFTVWNVRAGYNGPPWLRVLYDNEKKWITVLEVLPRRQRLTQSGFDRRKHIAQRDGGLRCAYCGIEGPVEDLVLEHVVPRWRGGSDGNINRVRPCDQCDIEKNSMTPQEWQPGRIWGNPTIDNPRIPTRPVGGPPSKNLPSSTKAERQARRTKRRLETTPPEFLRWCVECQWIIDIRGPHLTDPYTSGHEVKRFMAEGYAEDADEMAALAEADMAAGYETLDME